MISMALIRPAVLSALLGVCLTFAPACAPDLRLGSTATGGTSGHGGGGGSDGGSTGGDGNSGGMHLFGTAFGDGADQGAEALAVTTDGKVVVAGTNAGGISLPPVGMLTSTSSDDAFVAGVDLQGQPALLFGFGDAAPQRALAVAAGPAGRIGVAGVFAGTIGQATPPVTSAGGMDGFIAVLDGGAPAWFLGFGDGGFQEATALAFDASGNLFVAGTFSGSIAFPGGQPIQSTGGYDAFAAKLDKDGKQIWAARFGGELDQRATGLAVTSDGDVLVLGEFEGKADLGALVLPSAGSTDVFVVKLGASGTFAWGKRFGDATAQTARGLAVGPDGSVVVAGESAGSIDCGGGPLVTGLGGALFVAKLDAGSKHVWSRGFPRTGSAAVGGAAVDAEGSVVLAGEVTGSVDFGAGPLVSAGAEDVFAVKLDKSGRLRWRRRFGDEASQRARAVGVDALGNAWIAGRFAGTLDFGGGPLMSAGGDDVFLVELSP